MKIAFYIILFVVSFLFIAHTQITFKPFSISLPYWHRAVGISLVVFGVLIYNIGETISGYKKGYEDGIEKTIKYLIDKSKEEIK